jgi:hypothetical protein
MIVKVRKDGNPLLDLAELPGQTAGAWEVGQLLSYESGDAVKLDANAEDASFCGISLDKKVANVTYPNIVVLTRCIAEADVASAAYTFGQELMYDEDNDVLVAANGTSTICWSWQDTDGASVTKLKVKFDVMQLGKLFPVSA